MQVTTRTVRADDVDPLAHAFASWPKPRELFERYALRVAGGALDMVVADAESHLVGYLLIRRRSYTNPYRWDGTPGQTGPANLGPLTRSEHNA